MLYIKNFLKSFQKKEDGAVAIIVAITLIAVLFGVLSLSIDLNRAQTSYTHNYNATDAAALAGAEMWLNAKIDAIGKIPDPLDFAPSEEDMTEYAKDVLTQNFSRDQASSDFLDNSTFNVTMNESRQANGKIRYSVQVDACAELDTPISNVPEHTQDTENAGVAKTCTSSTAGFDLGKLENAEVAFALDFTESMYWRGLNQGCPPGVPNTQCPTFEETKAFALQDAMEYVFDEYFDSSQESTAFASIVPYTSFVNAYPFNDNGVVEEQTGRIDIDNKRFFGSNFEDPSNAFSRYRPITFPMLVGRDLRNNELDPLFRTTSDGDVSANYVFFYNDRSSGSDEFYETDNYSSILNRLPAILNSNQLDNIIDNPRNLSFLPFDNYYSMINQTQDSNFVSDKNLSSATRFLPNDAGSSAPEKQYAQMVCYPWSIAAAADERIDGPLFASDWIRGRNPDGRFIELHEAFPIQPLTNDSDVLNNVLERYVSDDRLRSNSTYNEDDVVDFQGRLEKAHTISSEHDTSSIHGLMWAWFTINNAWQDIWDEESLHENYVAGGSKSARDGSNGQDQLPSENNFKHIILISDGFDNDGCNTVTGGFTTESVNEFLGRRNSCDAYAPIENISDEQYNDLCTAIKTNGTTSDNSDDTSIHIVTLDFDAEFGGSQPSCEKAEGENNRFARCATPGQYFNNVTPEILRSIFDDIFAGILTAAVPVRLIK